MVNKIEFNIDDERAGKIAEVIANKTCKKILNLIAESDKELSVGDISSKLKIPLNTADYNVKKLVHSGLIEKTSNFFWSVKGKKIPIYKIANKKIIISPKTSFKGILTSLIAGGFIFGGLKILTNSINTNRVNLAESAPAANDLLYTASKATDTSNFVESHSIFLNILPWILIGILVGFGFYFIIKIVRRYMKKA